MKISKIWTSYFGGQDNREKSFTGVAKSDCYTLKGRVSPEYEVGKQDPFMGPIIKLLEYFEREEKF